MKQYNGGVGEKAKRGLKSVYPLKLKYITPRVTRQDKDGLKNRKTRRDFHSDNLHCLVSIVRINQGLFKGCTEIFDSFGFF